jgi:predicted DNA-binding transcriptional regulator AlpA
MNAFVGQTFQMNQLISIKQVVGFVGVGRSTIYEMMDENSPYYDPSFQRKLKLLKIVSAGQLMRSINGLKVSWRVENKGCF